MATRPEMDVPALDMVPAAAPELPEMLENVYDDMAAPPVPTVAAVNARLAVVALKAVATRAVGAACETALAEARESPDVPVALVAVS